MSNGGFLKPQARPALWIVLGILVIAGISYTAWGQLRDDAVTHARQETTIAIAGHEKEGHQQTQVAIEELKVGLGKMAGEVVENSNSLARIEGILQEAHRQEARRVDRRVEVRSPPSQRELFESP